MFARVEWRLAVALAIGLLIGVERERKRRNPKRQSVAGIRTFALAALLGGVLHTIGPMELVVAGFVGVVSLTAISYLTTNHEDRGLTTEFALVLTYGLGVLAQVHPLPALSAGVMTAFLLVMRGPLHKAARELITRSELFDAITFAVAALVVLPLVPNRTVDPWSVVNPFVLWRLAVVMMAITSVGYIALRFVGPRYGLFVAGFASGFVSSSATINAMGLRAKEDQTLVAPAVAGAAASTIATFVQLAILVGAASPSLLRAVALPVAAGGVTAAAFATVVTLRSATSASPTAPKGRPFQWRGTLAFVAIVALVTLGSTGLKRAFGQVGALVGAVVGAFADAHASASALAAMNAEDRMDIPTAALGIVLAVSTNTVTKTIMALGSRTRAYYARVLVGLALVLGAVWAGYGASLALGMS